MALGALSLSVTQGVQGRPFQATINGLTTGNVDVLVGYTPGFSTVNGKVMSSGLPYAVNTVVLREYDPGQGVGYRDSSIEITAATRDALRTQALASLGAGRNLVRSYVAGTRQADGALTYKLIVEDDLGASLPFDLGAATPTPTPTPAPTPTPTPTSRLLVIDDDWEIDSDAALMMATVSGVLRDVPGAYRLGAIIASSPVPTSGPVARGFADYHRQSGPVIPVGAYQGRRKLFASLAWKNIHSPWSPSVQALTGQIGKTSADFPDAVRTLRQLCVTETGSDGVYLITGGHAVLAEMWQSQGDDISPLTGKALFDARFSDIYCLAGQQGANGSATSTAGDYNATHDATAAVYVNTNSSKPIHFMGGTISAAQKAGPPLSRDPNLDPYRTALIAARTADPSAVDVNGKRVAAYDAAAALYALKRGGFYDEVRGTNTLNAAGDQSWVNDPAGRDYAAVRISTVQAIDTELDRLINLAYTPASPVLTPNAGRLWTPADLPAANRLFHFDAQDAASVVQNSGVVSGWNDQFGLRNVSQADTARQPTYSDNVGSTGYAGITFVDDRLDGLLTGLSATDTIAVFFCLINAGGNANDARLFSAATPTGNDFTAPNAFIIIKSNSVQARAFVSGRASASTGPSITAGQVKVLGFNQSLRTSIWEAADIHNDSAEGAALDISGIGRFAFGSAVHGSTEDFKGTMLEVVGLRNPTQDQMDRAQAYMMHRRNLPASMSGRATYRVTAPRWPA